MSELKKGGNRRQNRHQDHTTQKNRNFQPPPNSWESEVSILCCILLDSSLLSRCITENLKENDFYDSRNRAVYHAMLSLFNNSTLIDYMSLTSELERMKLLGSVVTMDYLLSIAEYMPAPMNINYFIERVKNLSTVRKYMGTARQIEMAALNEAEPEALRQLAWSLLLDEREGNNQYMTAGELIAKDVDLHEVFAHGVRVQQRTIWGIVGATGTGKTEFALDFSLSYALQDPDNAVLFCEYEGTEDDLALRLKRKARGNAEWRTGSIYPIMKPDFTKIMDFVRRNENRNILIVIDYLQRFARKIQAEDERPGENLRLYVNTIYEFFDRLRSEHPSVSVCLLMSMSKTGINEVSRQRTAEKMDLLNSIKESGDVQYDLDYAYALLFADEPDGERLYLSRFTPSGKSRKYMYLYPIKDSRTGSPPETSVYCFSPERFSYERAKAVSGGEKGSRKPRSPSESQENEEHPL